MFEAAASLAAAWRKKKLRRNKWAVTPFFLFCCDIHSYFEISSCRKLLGQDEYLCVPKFRNRIRVGQFVPWETTSLCPPCCPLVVLGRNNLWRSVPVCFLMKHFRLEGGGGEFVEASIIAIQIGTRQSWIKVSAAGDHEVRRIRVLLPPPAPPPPGEAQDWK